MARERMISGSQITPDEDKIQLTLRPSKMSEYIGQRELRGKLKVTLDAAKGRGEAVEHVLFYGPPGLGKNHPGPYHR